MALVFGDEPEAEVSVSAGAVSCVWFGSDHGFDIFFVFAGPRLF